MIIVEGEEDKFNQILYKLNLVQAKKTQVQAISFELTLFAKRNRNNSILKTLREKTDLNDLTCEALQIALQNEFHGLSRVCFIFSS